MEDITVHSEEHHNRTNVYIASAKLIESADANLARRLTNHIPGITMISHGGQIADQQSMVSMDIAYKSWQSQHPSQRSGLGHRTRTQ